MSLIVCTLQAQLTIPALKLALTNKILLISHKAIAAARIYQPKTTT